MLTVEWREKNLIHFIYNIWNVYVSSDCFIQILSKCKQIYSNLIHRIPIRTSNNFVFLFFFCEKKQRFVIFYASYIIHIRIYNNNNIVRVFDIIIDNTSHTTVKIYTTILHLCCYYKVAKLFNSGFALYKKNSLEDWDTHNNIDIYVLVFHFKFYWKSKIFRFSENHLNCMENFYCFNSIRNVCDEQFSEISYRKLLWHIVRLQIVCVSKNWGTCIEFFQDIYWKKLWKLYPVVIRTTSITRNWIFLLLYFLISSARKWNKLKIFS